MSKEKRLEKIRKNPKNISFEEIDRLLIAYGFIKREGKGSHTIYKCSSKTITIPRKRPIKSIYIKKAIELIDHIVMEG